MNSATAEAVGPVESMCAKVKEFLAELSEFKVEMNVYKKQVEAAKQMETSLAKLERLQRTLNFGKALEKQGAALKENWAEMAAQAGELFRNREYLMWCPSEIKAGMELNSIIESHRHMFDSL